MLCTTGGCVFLVGEIMRARFFRAFVCRSGEFVGGLCLLGVRYTGTEMDGYVFVFVFGFGGVPCSLLSHSFATEAGFGSLAGVYAGACLHVITAWPRV